MTLDDAKREWRQEPLARESFDELLVSVRTAERFRSNVLMRDLRETLAGLFAFVGYIPALFIFTDWLPWLGVWVVMISMLAIIAVFHVVRLRVPEPAIEAPPRAYFAQELARLDLQIRLLRSVGLWYCTPPLVGVCMIVAGLLMPLPVYAVLFCLGFCFFGWVIHQINQRYVRTHLLPLRQELADRVAAWPDEPTVTGEVGREAADENQEVDET